MASPSTLEVFARFGADAFGLERTLRMAQAILQVLASYSLPFTLLLSLLSLAQSPTASSPDSTITLAVVRELRSRVAVVRRFFRVFRFVDNFQTAYNLLHPPAPPKDGRRGAEVWLDVLGRSFNGMYLLLETLTLPDALAVPGLSAWGPDFGAKLSIEAQRFWFFALVCGVALGFVRIVKLYAYQPVPQTGEGFGDGRKPAETEGNGEKGESGEQEATDGTEAWKKDRERLRRNIQSRREQRRKWLRETRAKLRKILRRLVADTLDLALPGAVVGWVPVGPGPVGVITMITTYLTGLEVWERCVREVTQAKAAAAASAK